MKIIRKKKLKKTSVDHSPIITTLISALIVSPLWGAIDSRDKLRKDNATPLRGNPPLDTSALEESYQMHLQLQESIISSVGSGVECTDLECGQSDCGRKRNKAKFDSSGGECTDLECGQSDCERKRNKAKKVRRVS